MDTAIITFSLYMLMSFFYRNSAKTAIKDIPTNWELYHNHYKIPSKFLRRMFGLKKNSIPKFLCFRLYLSFVSGILALINAIIVLGVHNQDLLFKIMAYSCAFFGIIDNIQFIIMYYIFKKYKKKRG